MMSQNQANRTASLPMFKAMVGIGLFCGLLIAMTHEGTFSRIAKNRAEALQKAIFSVVPNADSVQTYTWKDGSFAMGIEEGDKIFACYDENGSLVGFAIEAGAMGYADIITALYGYDHEKQAVVGISILQSKETPGLGDKIEKDPEFLKNFEALDASLNEAGTSVQNEIITVKSGTKSNPWEVDGITGATISSKAIGELLSKSTAHWAPILNQNIDRFKEGRVLEESRSL